MSDVDNVIAKTNSNVMDDGQQPRGRMSASIPNAIVAFFENNDNYDDDDDDINLILPANHSLRNTNFYSWGTARA